MGYTKHAVKGISWVGAARVVVRGLTFVKIVIISRILTPTQFGFFGIAMLILALFEILTETGINIFLVQKKEQMEKYINTAWIVSIIRGIVVTLLIALSAPFIASFFHAPESLNLLYLTSIVPLVRGFINPSIVTFQKELYFHKEFFFKSSIFLVETILSVIFVIVSKSVDGLIWAMIASALLEVVLSIVLIKPRPTFVFEKLKFFQIIHFGKWVTLAGIFNYFYQHGDDIAVGRILGSGSLGLYDMAYRISLAPLTDFSDVIARVAYPVYVKISGDKERLQTAFLKSLMLVLGCVIPIGIIIFFFPAQIISIVLGQKWLAAVPVLQILAIFSIVRAVSVFSTTVFLSIEKQNVVGIISFVGFMGLLITIVPFIHFWGIVGAGAGALFGTICTLPIIFYHLKKTVFHKE